MKKILIIGAGFLQSFVIRKARNMGYYTIAVDADPKAIGFSDANEYRVINIVDAKGCLEYAKEKNIDGVLTAATDYGVLTAAYIAQKMDLPGLKYDVAKVIKNKYQVRKCLFENNVDDTEQAYEVSDNTNLNDIKNQLKYPVMVKPCDGSGSRGASRVNSESELEKACKAAIKSSLTGRAEIETFIDGKEYGVESLVTSDGIHVLGIMKKSMTDPPYYAELGHSIPTDLFDETEKHIKNCVVRAIKALKINFGSVNMDLLVTSNGKIHIVDIGARMGGNMIGPCIIPYGTGIDYMANMIRNAVSDPLDWNIKIHTAVATKLIAFTENARINKLPDFDFIEKKFDVEIYHHMSEGDVVSEYHTNLDGCGYIISKADVAETAEKKAESALKYIKNCILN